MLWLSLECILCSCIEWELWEAWMAWMEVVWGVFIASNHFLVIGWLWCRWAHRIVRWCTGHCTVHCSVRATSPDRWGLELLTIEVLCPLVAPNSPVVHQTVRCVLTLQTGSDFWWSDCTVVDLGEVDCCSVGALDSPVAHRTVRWIIAGELLRKPESGQFTRAVV
jgi:hypothetical protein